MTDDLFDEGWAGTVTTDRILAIAAGLLGGVLTIVGLVLFEVRRTTRIARRTP